MATIQTTAFTVSNAKATEMVDIICQEYNYQTTVPDGNGRSIPNPQTKAQFTQAIIDNFFQTWLKNMYRTYKERVAAAAADTNLD